MRQLTSKHTGGDPVLKQVLAIFAVEINVVRRSVQQQFDFPNLDERFARASENRKIFQQAETLAASEPLECPGSCDWCSGQQCCPGFAGSNNVTSPCMCQRTTRLTESSACDAIRRRSMSAHTTWMAATFNSAWIVRRCPQSWESIRSAFNVNLYSSTRMTGVVALGRVLP